MRGSLLLLFILSPPLLGESRLLAQQATVRSPFSRVSQGYTENIGVQWGFRFPGGSFQFGGPPPAAAAGGARFGSRFGSGDTGGYFNLYAGQSAQTGFSGGSSAVTVGNGQTGGVFEGRQAPFVLGLVPVVGDFGAGAASPGVPYAPRSVLEERVERLRAEGVELTAPRAKEETVPGDALPAASPAPPTGVVPPPAGSVEALSRAKADDDAVQAARTRQEVDALLAKAAAAREAGKPGLTRLYLQMALRRASPSQQSSIAEQLRAVAP